MISGNFYTTVSVVFELSLSRTDSATSPRGTAAAVEQQWNSNRPGTSSACFSCHYAGSEAARSPPVVHKRPLATPTQPKWPLPATYPTTCRTSPIPTPYTCDLTPLQLGFHPPPLTQHSAAPPHYHPPTLGKLGAFATRGLGTGTTTAPRPSRGHVAPHFPAPTAHSTVSPDWLPTVVSLSAARGQHLGVAAPPRAQPVAARGGAGRESSSWAVV